MPEQISSRIARRTGLGAGVFSLLLVFAVTAHAQIGGGSIVGNVTDQSGAAVPNATVKVVNTATNAASTAVANGEGYYDPI